jgi:ribosomal 50S subunit-recycling heat shock protein
MEVKGLRIDKYLKVSRLIKRRTLASEACDQGRVKINNKTAKPSNEVKVGDIIEIQFGNSNVKVEVISITETVSKNDAKGMYIEKSD